jgi:hypothetical protein
VDVVAAAGADFPDAVVGFHPACLDGLDHGADEAPVIGRDGRAALGEEGDEIDDRAEDVELDLVRGGVAEAHGFAVGVAGQVPEISASGGRWWPVTV